MDEPDAVAGSGLPTKLRIATGTNAWPVDVALTREGAQLRGTWTRRIAALPAFAPGVLAAAASASVAINGRAGDSQRMYPTPWLKSSP